KRVPRLSRGKTGFHFSGSCSRSERRLQSLVLTRFRHANSPTPSSAGQAFARKRSSQALNDSARYGLRLFCLQIVRFLHRHRKKPGQTRGFESFLTWKGGPFKSHLSATVTRTRE